MPRGRPSFSEPDVQLASDLQRRVATLLGHYECCLQFDRPAGWCGTWESGYTDIDPLAGVQLTVRRGDGFSAGLSERVDVDQAIEQLRPAEQRGARALIRRGPPALDKARATWSELAREHGMPPDVLRSAARSAILRIADLWR
jgi:hypothetical protein